MYRVAPPPHINESYLIELTDKNISDIKSISSGFLGYLKLHKAYTHWCVTALELILIIG